jgi:hypothetical protein
MLMTMCRRLNSLPPVSAPHSVDLLKGRYVQHPEFRLHAYDFIRLGCHYQRPSHNVQTSCNSLPPVSAPHSEDLLKGRHVQHPELRLHAYDFMRLGCHYQRPSHNVQTS